MTSYTNIRIAVRNPFLLLFTLFTSLSAFAQTDYREKVLEGTPINVTNREGGDNPLLTGPSGQSLSPPNTTSSASAANSGISETIGSLSVSLTGAAEYHVPIMVPPGIGGAAPEIALAYNSQAGNGMAGYGWNLSGISSITRIPATTYHDRTIDPVDFDQLDRFALDGQRLILLSGTYGGNGATYGTENYSNLRITSQGVSPYGAEFGPASFKVEYPNGSVALYGATSGSRSRMEFAITSWTDPQGVVIEYGYNTSNNTLRITSIDYGHRSGGSAPNRIEFLYTVRGRGEQAFVGGVDFRNIWLLSQIRVKSENVGYRSYSLAHDTNDLGYQRLTSVTENSGDNSKSHSPLIFSYDDTQNLLNSTSLNTNLNVNNIEARNASVVSLDYTGNGKMDFIVYPSTSSERNKAWIFRDYQSGNSNIGSEVDLSPFEHMFPVNYLNASNKLDKAQGFALVTHSGSNQVKFKINGQSSYGPAAQYYEKTWTAPTRISDYNCDQDNLSVAPMTYLSGDFNGDGLTDVVAVTQPYTNTWCSRPSGCDNDPDPRDDPNGEDEDGNNYATPAENVDLALQSANNVGDCACSCTNSDYNTGSAYFIDLDRRLATGFVRGLGNLAAPWEENMTLQTGDVNGDGKTDILQFAQGKVYVYSLNSDNSLQLLWSFSDSRIKLQFQALLGDYNGDGKTDFMLPFGADSSNFAMFRSTGEQFVKTEKTFPFTYRLSTTATSPVSTYNLIPTDMNGDGRTDILEYTTYTNNNGANGSQTLKVYGNSASPSSGLTPEFTLLTNHSINGNVNHFPIPVFLGSEDRKNDNLDFATISNNRVFQWRFRKDHRADMLLRGVSNNGVLHSIAYNDLDPSVNGSDGRPVYEGLLEQVYPYYDIAVSRGTKVVTEIVRQVSGTPDVKKAFAYQGAVVHADGLGFMGFTGVAQSEWHTGNADRIWNISKYYMLLRGVLLQTYKIPYTVNFNTIPSDYILRKDFTYSGGADAIRIFTIVKTSETLQNRLEGTAIYRSYDHDDYNNPTIITTDYSGQGSHRVDFTYANGTGSAYFIGRITNKRERTVIGGNSFENEVQYSYTGYLPTTIKTKGDGTQFVTSTMQYDSFGNLVRQTTLPYGGTVRNLNYEYDASGRFLVKSVDVEGLAVEQEYDPVNGTMIEQTDPYGRTSTFSYDSWDRLSKTTDYLGKSMNIGYTESGYSYTVAQTHEDQSGTVSVYDSLKRLVKQSYRNVLGEWVHTSYEYDAFDRAYKVSEPYKGTAPTQWNLTEYDLYGRPEKVTSYTGKVANITYSGQTITANDGTKTVSKTYDAMGNIVNAVDPGGTITYEYYGNGTLKSSNFNGSIVRVEQDGWGRRTKLIDPSAGAYTYEYNSYDQLVKETTPKGTTEYEYSNVGKLLQKKITGDGGTDITVGYSYENNSKLLSQVTLNNADGNEGSTTYTYDSFKRLSESIESNTYARFSKKFTYDSFGRIDSEENEARLLSNGTSSKVKVRNSYAYGQLKNINDFGDGEELWKVTGLNARGQITATTMGDGLGTNSNYDSYGYVTEIAAQKNIGTSPVELMTLGYDFDAQRGTLKSRTNSLFDWEETFTYDNLDRLLSFDDNEGAKSQDYDDRGRIRELSQLGTFSYSGNGFQPTGIDFNKSGEAFYADYTQQEVSYNAFKSPIDIKEAGRDSYSFQYNASEGRANMFFGGTDTDLERRDYRRHYSEDGSMEISWDRNTGKTAFVTYIGGDAYTAPTVYHSEHRNGTATEQYLYLHRDYQGSILAITDRDGDIKEKRLFDAWGRIVEWTDGNDRDLSKGFASGGYLDRGYTGHEHLFGVHLIHMNGRLYDPMLHRFLMPDNFVQDPFNTQNYNRYSYVLNNPLMYIDPSGEMTEEGEGNLWETLAYVATVVGASAASSWDWIKKQGKGIGNWIGKQARGVGNFFENTWKGVKNFFGGRGSEGPKPVVYHMDMPVNMSASAGNNLGLFESSGMGGLQIGPAMGPFTGNQGPKTQSESQNEEYDFSSYEYASYSLVLLADNWTGVGVVDDVLIPVAYTVATGVFLYDNRELLMKQGREMARIVEKALMTPGFQYSLRARKAGYYPNVRGGSTYLNAGDVWKYGETTQGFSRYSDNYLKNTGLGLEMIPEHFGSVWEIKLMEKSKIYGYFFTHGTLPPGNRIFR